MNENQQDLNAQQLNDVSETSSGIGVPPTDEVDVSVAPSDEPEVSATSQADAITSPGLAAPATEENQEFPAATRVSSEAATGATASLEALKQEVEALSSQLSESKNQSDTFKNQYMRIAADFDNFRKRTTKEKQDLEVKVKCDTISELLSVVDTFERARSQIKPQNDGEMTIHKSYQGVYKQLVDALKKIGVSPMRPEGKDFDPNLHEAVMRQPTEEHPEGTVMEELVRGYFLGDRILRHALVKVAAPPEPVAEAATEQDATPT